MEEKKEIIVGSIDHYIYQSDDSLYKVAKVITTDGDDILIVGSFPILEEGLNYEFVGNYKEHPKYGIQFQISSYVKSQSFTKEGLINYLSSDKFFGVGPKLATNIVDELGLDCIEKILKDENVLDSVYQMTTAKKKVISTVLKENYADEQVFIRLYGFGLSNTMIYRLYEVYGVSAANIIEENPYILIYEVEGFGFKKSDQLALRLGFKEDDELRLKEALRYTLNTVCYQQGYTFLTDVQLINSSMNLLNNSELIKEERLEILLNELVELGKIIEEDKRYYDPVLYKAELNVANKIKKIKNTNFKVPSLEKIDEYINQVEIDLDITYTDLQKESIKKALSNKLTIITGGPGTGKSTIINGIIRTYSLLNKLTFPCDELDMKVLMMAPTGRAAKRMIEVTNFKSSTIHKALGYNFEGNFLMNENSVFSQSLIIVDEASMIDINLASSLLSAISNNAQLILVGDENQLPSVGPGNVFHDLIASDIFYVCKLKQIMRQALNSDIVKISNMVLSEKIDYRILANKKEVYFYQSDIINLSNVIFKIIDSYLNNSSNDLHSGLQILIPMYAGIAGIDNINKKISERYNKNDPILVRENLVLKKEDKVLQLKNDPELGIMNGDIGKVLDSVKIKEKDYLLIDFDGKVISYPCKDVENLRLAYAISIHKSQGSEYDNVIMPILPAYNMMLRKKIIYTGITRAKKKLILIGNIDSINFAIARKDIIRQTSLTSKIINDVKVIKIIDKDIPFDTLGEYDMENISPYSFM